MFLFICVKIYYICTNLQSAKSFYMFWINNFAVSLQSFINVYLPFLDWTRCYIVFCKLINYLCCLKVLDMKYLQQNKTKQNVYNFDILIFLVNTNIGGMQEKIKYLPIHFVSHLIFFKNMETNCLLISICCET